MTHESSLARYGATLALAVATAACSASDSERHIGTERAATVVQTLEIDGKLVNYRQRLTLASIGSAPVLLGNGKLLDVAHAASSSLVRHRKLAQEVAGARAALLAPAVTTEELIETEHTVILLATTTLTVVDPAALRNGSPMFRKFHMKGPSGMPLGALRPEQRAAFAEFKAEMLQKPRSHPLGAAARKGDIALWAAATSGEGDFVITTKVEVPIGGLNIDAGTYEAPALTNGSFDYTTTHSARIPGGFGSDHPPFEDEKTLGINAVLESGSATTETAFINGFTEGDAYEWDETWRFGIGHVKVEAGASWGLGLRIPTKVTGVIEPTDIGHVGDDEDVESEFSSSIKVDVLDADTDFYREAGIEDDELYDGHEFVANADAHVTVEVELLKWIDLHITRGIGADYDQNFSPPFDGCGTDCGLNVWIPPWLTKTQISAKIAGASAQVGFNISGEGEVELDYETTYDREPVKSSSGAGDGEKTHRLSFTNDDERNFHTTLAPLKEHGHQLFGYQVSNVDYTWNIKVTPGVRGNVWVDCWLLEWDDGIGPFWLDFAAVDLGSVTFQTHDGTRSSQAVNKGQKSWSEVGVGQNPDIDGASSPDDVFVPPPVEEVEPTQGHDEGEPGQNLPERDDPNYEATPQGQLPNSGHLPELEQPPSRDPLDDLDP